MGDKQRKPNGDETGASPQAEEGAEGAFDLWLRRSLHRLYDGVAQEPLPPELLELIETDRASRREK
jgi:hypothetical protein